MPLRFGTSGVRGLVGEMTDRECFLFATAFVRHLRRGGPVSRMALGGDLRSSTPRILNAVRFALTREGIATDFFGAIPTPALCLYGMSSGQPGVMVTGSHIPDDRNGIKFNLATGEILKEDESGILEQYDCVRNHMEGRSLPFDSMGNLRESDRPWPTRDDAARRYVDRYLEFFPRTCLKGRRVVVYQHSSVSRDLLVELLEALGAKAVPVGRSDTFVPVDTEAVENERELAGIVTELGADALVSTDGDGDRPLVVAEDGRIVRGDLLGILTADYLGAEVVAAPVSCNTALERSNRSRRIFRTRIGSPFVIEAMTVAVAEGHERVVGFEANGGFLTATDFADPAGATLKALPTRDAALPILACLHAAVLRGGPLTNLLATLPSRFTAARLIRAFPSELGQAVLQALREEGLGLVRELFGVRFPAPVEMDFTDGARIALENGEIVHFRPSGNAPEFRCYTEADDDARAEALALAASEILEQRLRPLAEARLEAL
jgi:phosphomannomutase